MSPLISLSILLAIFSASWAVNCPNVQPVQNFFFNQFNTMAWYQIASYDNSWFGSNTECVRGYWCSGGGDDTVVIILAVTGGNRDYYLGSLSPLDDNVGNVAFSLRKQDGSPAATFNMKIIATDYDSYVVIYKCSAEEENLFVLAKDTDGPGFAKAISVINNNDFINKNRLNWHIFNENTCQMSGPFM